MRRSRHGPEQAEKEHVFGMGLLSGWPRTREKRPNLEREPESGIFPGTAESEDAPGPKRSTQRMSWNEICDCEAYRHRWVALAACRYDEAGRATEGAVVDCDDDLVELCSRLRNKDCKNCSILFADED